MNMFLAIYPPSKFLWLIGYILCCLQEQKPKRLYNCINWPQVSLIYELNTPLGEKLEIGDKTGLTNSMKSDMVSSFPMIIF